MEDTQCSQFAIHEVKTTFAFIEGALPHGVKCWTHKMCRCIVTHINVRQGLALWSFCCAEQVAETVNR